MPAQPVTLTPLLVCQQLQIMLIKNVVKFLQKDIELLFKLLHKI